MAEAGTVQPGVAARLPARPVSWLRAAGINLADVLLPVSVALWGLGVSQTKTLVLGGYGLLGVLPVVFYAGLAVLLISIGWEFLRPELSGWRMSLHATVLVIMLYGTAPLVYREGRYSWLYKTVGVVQYVNAHGQLNRHIDIYQNWPGFFAFTAWFDKIAGVTSPLAYAKWSQLVIELAALPILYQIYKALSLPARQRWAAILLYSAANWIAQDYFSPQALGTLLSLGLFAIILRWLYTGNASGNSKDARKAGDRKAAETARADDTRDASDQVAPPAHPAVFAVAVLAIYFVLTFTHELSPYLVLVQVAALAVFRLVRPRWLPVALAAIAIGYLVPRFAFVNSHFGLLKSIGDFFSNAAPPSARGGAQPLSERSIQYSADLLSAVVWGMALAGAWIRRNSRRTVITLLVLTFSPILVLGAQAYGNEGLLRVYLFSLPWAAALAAAVLAPMPRLSEINESLTARHGPLSLVTGNRSGPAKFRIPLVLSLVVALFLPAFFGDDNINVMRPGEVAGITSFFASAPAGPVYCPLISAPLADTARYNQFPATAIFGQFGLMENGQKITSAMNVITTNATVTTSRIGPAYMVFTHNMLADAEAYGTVSAQNYDYLLNSFTDSSTWIRVKSGPGWVIYELPPVKYIAPAAPPGQAVSPLLRPPSRTGNPGSGVVPAGGGGATKNRRSRKKG